MKPHDSARKYLTALASLSLLLTISPAQTAVYTGASGGSWSGGSNWTPNGVPNAVGAVVSGPASGTISVTQDLATATVGTISISGNTVFTISTGTNGLILDQDGAGSGVATIENASTSTGGRLIFSSGASPGYLQIADDLQIKQSNAASTASGTSGNGAINLTQRLIGTGSITVTNVLNDLNYGIVTFGGGTTTAGTYTGAITLAKGTLSWTSNAAFGATSGITLGSSSGGDVSFVSVQTPATVAANITVASGTGGTTVLGSSVSSTSLNQNFTGTVTLNQSLTVISQMTAADTSGVSLSGVVSGTGGLTINGTVKSSGSNVDTAGIVKLSGTNTYTGDTRVYKGQLLLGAASGTNSLALQNSTLNLASGDTGTVGFGLTSATTITSATFGGLSGSRDLALQNIATSPAAVALTVGNNNQSTTYSGALSGAGSLKKIGTGTLSLFGTNTYTGATQVNAGSLLVNGSITSAVIANAGTFGGSGSSTANITIGTGSGAGAIFAPGNNTVGTFTTTGSVSLLADATYALEFNSSTASFDKIVAAGLSIASGAHLTLTDLGTSTALTAGTQFTIFDNTSGSITGTFLGLADGQTITVGLNTFVINYNVGTGSNDIVLTVSAIPEPSTYAMLAGVLALGAAICRRTRVCTMA